MGSLCRVAAYLNISLKRDRESRAVFKNFLISNY